MVLLSIASSGWRCFFTIFWCVLLPSFPSCVPPLFCCVVLLGFLLLWVVLRFHPLLLGGAAFLSLPVGGGVFLLSSVGWCGLVSFGRCCFSNLLSGGAASSSSGWGCFFPLLFFWVVLLGFPFSGFSPSAFARCCFPFPPLGGGICFLSSVGWCCLVSSSFGCCFSDILSGGPTFLPFLFVGAAFLPSSGWYCLVSSFCWVVLLSKIKKKRRKVKGKLKTLAKWKKEKWKNEENAKMRKTRKISCGLLKSSAYGWPLLFVAAKEKTIVLELGLWLKVDFQILVVYNCFFFLDFFRFFMSVIFYPKAVWRGAWPTFKIFFNLFHISNPVFVFLMIFVLFIFWVEGFFFDFLIFWCFWSFSIILNVVHFFRFSVFFMSVIFYPKGIREEGLADFFQK